MAAITNSWLIFDWTEQCCAERDHSFIYGSQSTNLFVLYFTIHSFH